MDLQTCSILSYSFKAASLILSPALSCLQIITAQPDIMRIMLTPEDRFFVLACDGVWDVMSNQACVVLHCFFVSVSVLATAALTGSTAAWLQPLNLQPSWQFPCLA